MYKLLSKAMKECNQKYFFDTSTEQIVIPKSRGKRFLSYPRYHYICWNRKPFYYRKGEGIWDFFLCEDRQLLTEYQFRFVLKHTKQRNKELKQNRAVFLWDMIRAYKSLTTEQAAEPEKLYYDTYVPMAIKYPKADTPVQAAS